MSSERFKPEESDYYDEDETDYLGTGLAYFEVARRKVEEKIKGGDNSPLLQEAKKSLDEIIDLCEKIIVERDPDKRLELHDVFKEVSEKDRAIIDQLGLEKLREEEENLEVRLMSFKGNKGDSLSTESSLEFSQIMKSHSDNVLINKLHDWCMYYEGSDHLPINYAVDLWKRFGSREEIKSFVEDEFRRYKNSLTDHSLSLSEAKEIENWLNL